jgi:peptidoglycan/LPS O-acetylase OafA/YrhL
LSEAKEIRALTGLRGAAAIYVVLIHFWLYTGSVIHPRVFLSHGYLAVDLFFVLSGFVMTLNYAELFRGGWQRQSYRIFLSRRIARVYPLFMATTLVAAFLISRQGIESTGISLARDLPYNLLMLQSWSLAPSLDGPSWSISAEWAAYLFFPIALWLGHNPTGRRARFAVVFSIISIAVMCWLPTAVVHRPNAESLLDLHDPRGGWPVFRCLAEFFLGIFTARLYATQQTSWAQRSGWMATATGLAMLFFLEVRSSDFFFVLLCPVLVLCLTSRPGILARLLRNKAVHHLGVVSYSIYLVHILPLGFAYEHVTRHGRKHIEGYEAVAALLVYPMSLAAYFFIEKPCRRFIRVLLEGRQDTTPAPIDPLGLHAS